MLPEIAVKTNLVVNDQTYPIIEAGEGPLVVCLHGFPDNYESFQYQIEPLVKAGYRVVCPMMPGYVPETQPSPGSTTPIYACDEIIALIKTLLKSTGQPNCHLIGHDWGAVIAYMVAEKNPDLLQSLAVMSIPYNIALPRVFMRCPSYALNAWYITFFQLKWFADWCVKRNNLAFIDMLYRTWNPTWAKDKYAEHLSSVKETLKSPGVLKAALGYYRNSIYGLNPASFKFRRQFNGEITVPTLALRGELDKCIPEVAWDLISPRCFRNGITIEVVPNVAHFLQLESPQLISDRLVNWLKMSSD